MNTFYGHTVLKLSLYDISISKCLDPHKVTSLSPALVKWTSCLFVVLKLPATMNGLVMYQTATIHEVLTNFVQI